jgi:2-polyprenyl-3-methyl-5-hydroxy-6-metoxy-1,4-benzoquinol methylase
MLSHRSYQSELIDLGPPHYSLKEFEDCLQKLVRVGRWLGGDQANLRALFAIPDSIESILDVGCGGGFFTRLMAKQFPKARVVGIDINPLAIEFAKKRLAEMPDPPSNVSFELRDHPELQEAPGSYDVVIATLVCHHMGDEALVDFLKRACQVAKKKVILNDLHRHLLALLAFKVIAPIFLYNRLAVHDGAISIKRAFKREEWKQYLAQAGIKEDRYSIQWHWAFRWLIEIDCCPPT